MDYKLAAQGVLENIGGAQNVVSAAHCATRLRLVVADNAKVKKAAVEEVEGVKGCFEAAGQLQVIFGTGTVNKVYEEFVKLAGTDASATKEDVKKAAAAKAPWYKRGIKTLGDIFVPIIPAIVATGLLCGLLGGLARLFPGMADSHFFHLLDMFSNTALTFLPILIAVSAAKIFGGNVFLGAVIGMIMIHPSLVNAWAVSGGAQTADLWSWGFWHIQNVGYQGHVIPVVVAVLLMSTIEKKFHKIVPEMFDLFVTPLCTVLITGFLTMTVIGPVFALLETWVLGAAGFLISIPFGIGSFFMGAAYAPTVVAGVHHMYNAIELGMLAETGKNIWMPLATASNVAQGAAALAVAVKTKQKKIKSMALPASLSAFMGITEPAIFGVNVRFRKPFIAGMVGGAAGALVASITKVFATANGVTGIFGFLITTESFVGYLFTFVVATVVAFVCSWALYKDPPVVITVKSPMNGKAVALSETPDESFASGTLGKGVAFIPEEGAVYAPADGVVETLFDTKHAVGITATNGLEFLIHIGVNTVELGGKYFEAHIKEGDSVKAGQKLISFDMAKIKEAGYSLVTPFIVANSDDYEFIKIGELGNKTLKDSVFELKK